MRKPAQTIVSATLALAMAVSATPHAPIVALAEEASTQEQTSAAPEDGEKPVSSVDLPGIQDSDPATQATTSARSATATQNGVTFTVTWDDAPAGQATTFHVTQTGGSDQAKARMDVPTYWDTDGSQESVCDPTRDQWGSYHELGADGYGFTFELTASGTYRINFYFMDTSSNVWYLRTTAAITISDPSRPSVTQMVSDTVAQCRRETDGSEYAMALWLHDWELDQLEYDHSLNYCSAESGLTRHLGTCESYQRIYAKLLNAAGIANGRVEGNGHTWNAVKIDGKWCQMDLTWDDTSDNWYGDLDQRHLYFGLTDELMAIAHNDHTKNYQADGYAYRSIDLSNNYFVRNGKAAEWAEKYSGRIQEHIDAKETEFSIDADNQSFPPSISGIQNALVAYAMNQRKWSTSSEAVMLRAASNVTTISSYQWSASYDYTVEHPNLTPIFDGSYKIMSTISSTSGVIISESGCSMTKAARALYFKFDPSTDSYSITSDGKALAINGSEVILTTPDGSPAQQWSITAVEGGYSIVNAAAGNALDDRWRDTGEGALVWGYASSPGDPAQTWTLAVPATSSVADGQYRIMSSISSQMGVSALESGCTMSSTARYIEFSFDAGTGLYTLTAAGGKALAMAGTDLLLATPDGSPAQQWSITAVEGGYSIVNAAAGNALDDRWRDTGEGALVWGYASSPGDPAQTWTLVKAS